MHKPNHVLSPKINKRRSRFIGTLTLAVLGVTTSLVSARQPYSYSQSFYGASGGLAPPAGPAIPLPTGMIWVVEHASGYVIGNNGNTPPTPRAYSRATPTSPIEQIIYPSLRYVSTSDFGQPFFSIGEPVTAYFAGTFSIDSFTNWQANPSGSGVLSLTGYLTPSLGGDFNGDSVVNAADYTVIRDQSLYWGPGDYQQWTAGYGSSATSASASTTIPEPSAALLGLLGVASLLSRRVR